MLAFYCVLILILEALGWSSGKACTQEELDVCSAKARPILSWNPQRVTTEPELDDFCRRYHEGMKCVDGYVTRCLESKEKQQYDRVLQGVRRVMKHLCHDANYRKEYLMLFPCFNNISSEFQKQCEDALHRGRQEIKSDRNLGAEYKLKKLCKAFHNYLDCTHEISRITCGDSGAEFLTSLGETAAGPMVQEQCGLYHRPYIPKIILTKPPKTEAPTTSTTTTTEPTTTMKVTTSLMYAPTILPTIFGFDINIYRPYISTTLRPKIRIDKEQGANRYNKNTQKSTPSTSVGPKSAEKSSGKVNSPSAVVYILLDVISLIFICTAISLIM